MKDISICYSSEFRRNAKRLAKHYRSLRNDLRELVKSLQANPTQGTDLGGGLRKVRMAISAKGKGKRGGARVITYAIALERDGRLWLLTIYDKSEKESIGPQELERLLSDLLQG